MRRFVLGTAGHVDHGKTTLVRALTGIDTDRLPEEKRRGITIELGFAPWHLDESIDVSIIDVPGHRRFVHTMIAGAVGMELVLLVVAADEGVMPQTREHIAACELLGIRRAIVVVTKMDRVGEELAQLAGDEAVELLSGRMQTDVVLCSARTGEGLDNVRAMVKRALLELPPPAAAPRARLSVDRVFSVRGAGTVVTGTLVAGQIAAGAPLFVVGTGRAGQRSAEGEVHKTAARGLHVHDKPVNLAEAPTRLALNIAGLPLESVHRGDLVTDDATALPTRRLDVSLRAVAPVRHGMTISVYVGTARSSGKLDILGDPLEDGRYLARLRLADALAVVGGDRFVIRGSDIDGPSGAVLGGGIVLDARPPRKRPRGLRRAVLENLVEAREPQDVMRALANESSPHPFPRHELPSRFSMSAVDLERAGDKLGDKGELVRVKKYGFMLRTALIELAAKARVWVVEHHRKAPLDRGMVKETLRTRLSDIAGAEAADEIIKMAASSSSTVAGEPLVIDGDIVRSPSAAAAPARSGAEGPVGRALDALEKAGLKGLTEFMVKEATGAVPKEVKAILAKLVREGQSIHAGELWFFRKDIDGLRDKVKAHLEKQGRMTIADFKDLSGLGRRQAIPLLELFDREGVTKREADDSRVAGK
ncbi:MAG: selenocysteine-specific translation elongation factor [Polyangiaceae bacterium]|nr:selenocysteine-specific translation elongation factor [Polyangiaceae bacterium]